MPLETATYIDGLNASNPAASDTVSSADDHLRLIKSTIKATFPNVTGAVTMTQSQLNDIPNKAPLASPTFTGTPAAPTATAGTNTTQLATTAFVKTAVDAALQAAYPVGSIYINATSSTNPSTLLGFGTWVAFGSGRVMVGLDAGDASFDTAEETGGSKDAIVVSHTHTATSTVTDPGHRHSIIESSPGTTASGAVADGASASPNTDPTAVQTATTGITVATTVASTGSSGTNANLQPYIVVRMWKRTA